MVAERSGMTGSVYRWGVLGGEPSTRGSRRRSLHIVETHRWQQFGNRTGKETARMGRYLLAAGSIPGHVLPMLSIATDLARRGHEVRLLTGREFTALAATRGIAVVPLPDEAEIERPPAPPRRSSTILRRLRIGRAELRSIFLAPLVAQYTALRREIERDPVDAILVDLAFVGAIPLLLAGRPRPMVSVCGVGPLMVSSVDTPPFGTGWRPRPEVSYHRMNRFAHEVLFRDIQGRLNAILESVGVARAPVFLTDWPVLADRIIQLTVPSFEYRRRDLPQNVVFVGPLPVEERVNDEVAPPVAGRPTRVHVTQGTWDNIDPTELIVPTLEAFADRDDLEVIATTGPGVRLPVPPPSNAWVSGFCSYSVLLPTVDVMITNGGYGGVHAALSHGVPLVVAGGTADKPEVAARVAHFGVGIDLRTARPTASEIAAAVDRILGTQSYRRAAQCIAGDIAGTHPYEVIDRTLSELVRFGPHPVRSTPRHDPLSARREESP